ncbi:MAG: DUF5996 family protein [Terriglobales bacterium]
MNSALTLDSTESWPPLALDEWQPTCDTLHMWTQIVGKVRMALTPPVNHFWHVPLYVTPRGLTTSPVPFGGETFEISFDFLAHALVIEASNNDTHLIELAPRTVADFYRELMATLRLMGIHLHINTMPQEVPNPIRFEQDTVHRSYDAEHVQRFWRILLAVDCVFKEFRGRFLGKCSPVHFFWGSFDLAVTRFSGRRAPERPGADAITRESYSHECSSGGWWPGGVTASGVEVPGAAFYSYAVPEPSGFADRAVLPEAAHYDRRLGEFLLMYDDVRRSPSPRQTLLDFLQSTYEAAADPALWERSQLEEPPGWFAKGGTHAA